MIRAPILLALAMLGAACGVREAGALDNREPIRMTRKVQVFIDPDTGCHYLLAVEGGITPRLTADGKQLCLL